jgi:hypothetical protein
MICTRIMTLGFSSREVMDALRAYYDKDIRVQAMPRDAACSVGLVEFRWSVPDAKVK